MKFARTVASDERLHVAHRDFVFVAPRGGWVIVADEQDHVRHISSLLIEEVAPMPETPPAKITQRT